MKITPTAAIVALQANPQAAAAFDSAAAREHPGKDRHAAVVATLQAFDARQTETAALRQKVSAAKARIAALQKAKDLNRKLRASLSTAKAKLGKQPAAPASATPLLDTFNSLTGTERTAFYRKNERAIRLESLRADCPQAITPKA